MVVFTATMIRVVTNVYYQRYFEQMSCEGLCNCVVIIDEQCFVNTASCTYDVHVSIVANS